MKKISFVFLLIIALLNPVNGSPLHSHYKHTIIIDTDCAIDDMRAISLLLSLPTITIKAIMVSDGTLPPDEGALKVKALLKDFNRDTIPIYTGKKLKNINPSWRSFNQQLSRGNTTTAAVQTINLKQVANIIEQSKEQVTLFCLAPLTNIAQLIKNYPSILPQIEDIIWYNESANPLKGFNYECDKKSAETVLVCGRKINILSSLSKKEAVFDSYLFNQCKNTTSLVGKSIYTTHNQPLALKKLHENHFKLWDELAALFLINPELIEMEALKTNKNIRHNTNYNYEAIKEVITDIINGTYKPGEYVAFYGFPIEKNRYVYDVRCIMDSTISRFGLDEWKACVMTDEFHGHLGVFSIVGAKMGIRARDYFGIGTDLMQVVSFAGTTPPFSCMNDGIQVSTGATLGQGTIRIHNDSITKPIAIFTYQGKSIKITLKPEYLKQVESDIEQGITQFGLSDENYWSLIRQNALNYWKGWDRNNIFEIEEITNPH